MEMSIKQRIASGALALTLLGGTGVSVAAQQGGGGVTQRGGAAGLVAAVVQANDTVDVVVTDSFNNLRALNNILNNSPILSQNDLVIGDVLSGNEILTLKIGDVTIQNFLNSLSIDIDDVVAVVQVLGGGLVIVV